MALIVYIFFLVKEDTLLDMVTCMTKNVGLVHQMPFSCDRNGIPAASLEKVGSLIAIVISYTVSMMYLSRSTPVKRI